MATVRHAAAVTTGAAVLVALAGCGVGGAEDDDFFYAGEDVDLVVPYDPGGGYDVYARALAPFLSECLDAQVVVRNQPGAGGLVATNETAVADPDEPRLEILNMEGFAAAQIAGAEGVQFDLAEFSYAGRISTAPPSLAVATDSDIRTFHDIVQSNEPVRFVATGPGSEGYISAVVLADAYHFPVDVTTGFSGSDEARTAVIAGDADVEALAFDSQLAAIEAGDVRPLVLLAEEHVKELIETPLITRFPADSVQSRATVESLVDLGLTGRTIAGPPGMSKAHLREMREGFNCAMNDGRLRQQLQDQERPVEYASGDRATSQVREVLDASPDFQQAIKDAF